MSDPEKTPAQEEKKPENQPTPDDQKSDQQDGDQKDGGTVPEWKFSKTYKEKKEAEERAAEAERKLREREEKDAEAQGKHQELAEQYKRERDEANEKLERLNAEQEATNETFSSMLASALEEIPEEKRKLIPDSYSDRDKLSYINSNRSFLIGTDSKKSGTPSQPGNENQPPSDELDAKRKERDALIEKRRTSGSLTLLETKRMTQLTREIAELNKE